MNSIYQPGRGVFLWLLAFSVEAACAAATITRGPYLQSGTPSSMVLRWRTDTATGSSVRYGTNRSALTNLISDSTSVTDHVVSVSSLRASTKYYYEVGTAGTWFTGDTNDFFVTSPPIGTFKPSRIWVLGDSGTANSQAAAARDAFTTYNSNRPTDVWLMLGDNAYSSGTDAEYQAAVYDFYPQYLQNTVLWPTIGNHDAVSISTVYLAMFTLPQNGEAGGLASGTERYYSFDYANIHFVCLDSATSDLSASGAMCTWLSADLAATTQGWVIAYWHHPPYSKGSHDSDADSTSTKIRQNVLPILENFGVDLVLCGHSHSYERSVLLDGHYGTSDTLSAAMKKDAGDGRVDGTGAYQKSVGKNAHQGAVYTVAGSSGQVSGGPLNHAAMYISLNLVGSVVIDVNSNRLDMAFIRTDATTGDHFTILKTSAATNVPAAPTGLVATAISSSQINLVWRDNSTNEQGFKLERSTNGVNFTQVALFTAGVTNAADTNLAPSKTYSYRVRAYNAVGDSAYSSIAQATTFAAPVADTTPPAAVTNLFVSSVSSNRATLTWTAPGDDGSTGTATSYDVRYSTNLITTGNWATATQTLGEPAPALAGTAQTFIVTGLLAGRTYYFALKTSDETNNVSPLSNVANGTTTAVTPSDTAPPAAITNLNVVNITSNSVSLSWTAPGDDGNVGTARTNDVRYNSNFITAANWASATQASGEPAPTLAGTVQSFTVAGLVPGRTYYFAIKTLDETNNTSPLSNVRSATTLWPATNGGPVAFLIPSNAVWKYLDNGSNQSNVWRAVNYDDTTWASGRAQLGYGGGSEATVVSYGSSSSSKYITTYFRRHFTITDPTVLTNLFVSVQRDDGVVVYLNGTEVFRDNMPATAINYLTVASSGVSGTNKTAFHPSPAINAGSLVAGDNVVAAEVHQASASSSSMDFNLELSGVLTVPAVGIGMSTNGSVVLRWNSYPGKIYRVQYVTNVTSTAWVASGSDITAGGFSASATNALAGVQQRFYRVVLLP